MKLRSSLLYPVLVALVSCAGCVGLEMLVDPGSYTPLDAADEPTPVIRGSADIAPKMDAEEALADDRLDDKPAPAFDAERVDRRPDGRWLVNQSAAVLRLNVAPNDKDEAELMELHPSYAAACAAARNKPRDEILPSVNMLDGKAKQFDDGLYAALDQAYYRGLNGKMRSHVQLIQQLYAQVGKDSPAAPFLAAGLELAGVKVEVTDRAAKDRWLREFSVNEAASKPISFYTWNPTLAACFRFLRFFQHPFEPGDQRIAAALTDVLDKDDALRADYDKAIEFYSNLTNPPHYMSLAYLVNQHSHKRQQAPEAVAVFPASTSREAVLFEKLFANGLPANVSLMDEIIRRIRSGQVELKPTAGSGWYEYQVHALETMLLPAKGEEHAKLLLTNTYKKRMLECFKSLLTKRRETHARQSYCAVGCCTAAPPPPMPEKFKPRLRVEPCPSYYVRTARAYDFLANFLEANIGKETLQSLHGLCKEGERPQDLYTELHFMRELFYGLYLVSADDIGMKPILTADEGVDHDRCYQTAVAWLGKAFDDPDMAVDARLAVPVFTDTGRHITRLWATLGVRMVKLEVGYARPPHIKPVEGDDAWQPVDEFRLASQTYLIPVDEFAEFELSDMRVLNREELRVICDREKTKDAILKALRKR